jgi:ABC-type branched-subunit amino acid transport system substrate-binding protein
MEVLDNLDIKNIKYIIGSNPRFSANDVTKERLNKWRDKLIVAVDWHSECNSQDLFIGYIDSFSGGNLDRRTAAAFEAVQVLSNLFEKNPKITKEIIVSELKEVKKNPIISGVYSNGKTISFEENGDRHEITERVIVTSTSDGKFKAISNCSSQ